MRHLSAVPAVQTCYQPAQLVGVHADQLGVHPSQSIRHFPRRLRAIAAAPVNTPGPHGGTAKQFHNFPLPRLSTGTPYPNS